MLNKKNFIFILEKLFEQSKVCYDEFNSADGKIGDGDLGITIQNGFQEIVNNKENFTDDLGYNFLPSEISAAFALVQLKNLKKNIQNRSDNFDYLKKAISKSNNIRTFETYEGVYTGWLAFPIMLDGHLKNKRKEFQILLEKAGVQTRTIFTGNILRQPGFDKINCVGRADDFPQADNVMKNGILIACHHGLNSNQMEHIQESFKLFIQSKA